MLSCVQLFATPWTAAGQASLSITNSWSLLKLMSIKLVMPPNHLILCHPLLLPPSVFPSIRVFSNESVLCIRWPKYWSFSFSISPSNGGWSHFRLQFTCRHHTYLFHPLMLVPGISTHCRSQGTPFQNIPTTLPLITTPLLRDNQRLNQPRAPTSREKVREKEQTCRKSVLLLGDRKSVV